MDISQYRTDIQKLLLAIQKERAANSTNTIALCNELEQYGKQRNDNSLIGFARFTRGEIYYLLNDMPSFYREMLFCMEPLESIGEWGYLAMANNMLGIMSLNRGNAPFAMDYYSKAITLCKKYRLPDLEWIVHMNLGTMFLTVDNFDDALKHYSSSFEYIKKHKGDLDNYLDSLTAVCVGFGKAHLKKGDVAEAGKYKEILESECVPELAREEMVPVNCFLAGYYNMAGDEIKRNKCRDKIIEDFSDKVPIMDIFDDVYDFLKLLLEVRDDDAFREFMPRVEEITQRTIVRNLERKLVSLRIRYYRMLEMEEECAKAAIRFYELFELMEQENNMMVTNMISLRQEVLNLTAANDEALMANKSLQKQSQTDPLTGMYNRLRLNEYGEVAFDRALKNQIGVAVEILDIDFFKEYNDNYGHQKGDDVIRLIADSIKKLQRHGRIFAARYGGDEFVVIYEGYKYDEVFDLAKELKSIIVGARYVHEFSRTKTKFVTISQGVFWGVPQAGSSVWSYLHEADNLLYKVKAKSRNSVAVGHDPSEATQNALADRTHMETMQEMEE